VERKEAASHINEYRNHDHRVFYAAPFFNVDLRHEIRWHKGHLKKLRKHAQNPQKFYDEHYAHEPESHARKEHFHEHVLESIPFHQKLLREHELRYNAIRSMLSGRQYQRIVEISQRHGGTPEYFVFHKPSKEVFFVAEKLDDLRMHWVRLVRDIHGIADVVVLDRLGKVNP